MQNNYLRTIYDQNHTRNQFQWRPNLRPRGTLRSNQTYDYRQAVPLAIQNCNESHWCETCDRGFETMHLLENHKQQHQKCNIDGCQFVAHPKVVTKHIQMQHSSGLYKKIAKLDNPEEIKKWREERKRKYPTQHNIELKLAEIKEKIYRGEKMGLKNHGNNSRNKLGADVKRKHSFDNKSNLKKKIKRTSSTNNDMKYKISKMLPAINDKRIKPFNGIQNLIMNTHTDERIEESQSNFLIEDDDYVLLQEENDSKIEEPKICGALSSLISNYGTSDEEEIDMKTKVDQTPIMLKIDNKNNAPQSKISQGVNIRINGDNNNRSDDDSGPEEVSVKKLDNDTNDIKQQTESSKILCTKVKHLARNGNCHKKHNLPKRRLPSTLLEKLLYREMQQERNIVLQCIRYILKNNYFEYKKELM